jgi:hypothetical protein
VFASAPDQVLVVKVGCTSTADGAATSPRDRGVDGCLDLQARLHRTDGVVTKVALSGADSSSDASSGQRSALVLRRRQPRSDVMDFAVCVTVLEATVAHEVAPVSADHPGLTLAVSGSPREATLLIAGLTSYRNPEGGVQAECLRRLAAAAARSFSELEKRHVVDYSQFFGRYDATAVQQHPTFINV